MPDHHHNNNSLHIQTRLTVAPPGACSCSASVLLRLQQPRDMCPIQMSRVENVVPQWGQLNCARVGGGGGGPNAGEKASP